MKLTTKIVAALCMASLLAYKPLLAGDGKTFKEKVIVEEEATKWWGASLSTGWDSLFMFRGVNVIRNGLDYGSSLYWTDLSVTFNLTENDFITVGTWMAFGLNKTNYKELDVYVDYTHTIGNLALSFGYIFYDVLSGPFYSHELNWKIAYTIELPAGITVTPAVVYYLNLGPDTADTGIADQGSSFLQARIDAGIPIYKDIVSIEPWVAFGASFGYNFQEDGSTLTGVNNLEVGIGIPIKVNDVITVYGYGAYSAQWEDLAGTRPSTFWGGGKVTFSF